MRSGMAAAVAASCVVLGWGTPAAAQNVQFIRGDVNLDGGCDLSDIIGVLRHLFARGVKAPCEKAADFNGDGSVQVADAIYGLQYLFGGGTPPPPPFPRCGEDPAADPLTCGETACGLAPPTVSLEPSCTADPEVELGWTATNLEAWAATLEWALEGTALSGSVDLPAEGSATFTTPRVPGTNEVVLRWRGEEVARRAQAKIVISEIMASNANSLGDVHGESSDWIEVHFIDDACIASIDLTNWCLTDDPAELTKWRFPSVELQSGGYLIVFASGKDPLTVGTELHASFNLDRLGEYLALVAEDGVTIVDEFDPGYPEQLTDISYGVAQKTTTFVAAAGTVLYHVPVAADAPLGAGWAAPSYTPVGWSTGATGLGFSGIATQGFEVTCVKASIAVDNLTEARGVLTTPSWQSQVWTETASIIDYFNSGGSGNFTNDNPFPGLGFTDVEDFVVQVTGTVMIPEAGAWSFGVNSDDGFGMSLTNGAQTFTMEYPLPRGPADTINVFTIPQAGPYELTLVFYERGGGSELELFAAQGNHPSFSYDYFRLVGDTANGGLGLLGFASDIATDVGAAMKGRNASIWLRSSFTVTDVAALGQLLLRVKYEDGFVAYLNGFEVARRNAPASLAWNAAATLDRAIEDVPVAESINLTSSLHLLTDGQNVLAIHGLNDAASDGDFLIRPELVAASKAADYQYMATPTPGAFNVSGSFDFVRSVRFSVERGFYETPFSVLLSTATNGAQIRYTRNGSTPTSTTGTIYSGPISISGTSVIRARAFKANCLDSEVTTKTYFFVDDIIRQSPNGESPTAEWPSGSVNGQVVNYGMDPDIVNNARWGPMMEDALLAIPSISLVTDLGNLFNASTGIYVNARNDGRAWERRTSVEMIHPDGTPGFGVDAGLRIRGAFSRDPANPKHSFRLFFRSEYGAGRLEYPIFGGEGAETFDKVDLQTSQNYSWAYEGSTNNTMIREVFSRDVQADMHRPYTRSRYYHLYLNGQYWGLYQTQERVSADFAESYLHGAARDYDVIKNDSSGSRALEAADGTMDAYQRLYTRAVAGFSSNQAYLAVQGRKADGTLDPAGEKLLDPDNLIDYMVCTYYTGDADAPVSCWGHISNNLFAVYNRVRKDGFTWYRHDAEHSLGMAGGGINEARLLTDPTDRAIGQEWRDFNPAWLHLQLTANQEYLLRYADRVVKHLFNGGLLTSGPNIDRWMHRANMISQAIVAESARWGDSKSSTPRTKDDWQGQTDYMVGTYFPQRTQVSVSLMRSVTMFPAQAVVSFNRHGGEVAPGFQLLLSQGNGTPGTIYYTLDGSDPRLWGGAINPAAAIFVDETTSVSLIARGSTWRYKDDGSNQGTAWRAPGFADGGWKVGPAELGYGDGGEATIVDDGPDTNRYRTTYFRRQFNVTDAADIISLTLGIVVDDGAAVYLNGVEAIPRFNLPTGTIDYQTLATTAIGGADESMLHTYDVDPGLLVEGSNVIAVEIHQNSVTSTDLSFDLELTGLVAGTSSPPITLTETTTVKARVRSGITWGAMTEARFTIGLEGLVINEIMASNHLTLEDPAEPGEWPDWLELHNGTAGTIDLGGMYLTDDLQDLDKWRIAPGVTIAPGAYLIFYADDDGTQGIFHTNYKLGAGGDSLALVDNDGATIIDSIVFDAQREDVSFGRYPDGGDAWGFHVSATPGSPNRAHEP